MKCNHCGEEIANDSNFCEYCGTKIKKKSKLPWWAILLIVLVWLIVIGFWVRIGISLPDMIKSKIVVETDTLTDKTVPQGYVDLGLPSGTLWKDSNEEGFYTYDEAVNQFGNSLPTEEQWNELLTNCKVEMHFGRINIFYSVTGPNNSIITLPAEGCRECDGTIAVRCAYWSSSLAGSNRAYQVGDVHNNNIRTLGLYSVLRCSGQSVRLVYHQ